MIYNVPLHLQEQKRKPLTTVISLPSDSLVRFALVIGNGQQISGLLPQTSEGIVATNSIGAAQKMLKERLYNNITPSFIICEDKGNVAEMKQLLTFLGKEKHFRKIPFFVYTTQLSTEVKNSFGKIGGIDDVLSPSTSAADFTAKLQFARKFRLMSLKAAAQSKMQNSFSFRNIDVNYIAKRTFDIAISGTALLLISPLLFVIAAMIKIDSKGPVFYISRRAGANYRVFRFYKFRTMVADADKKVKELNHLNQYDVNGDKGPVFFKLSNDPRVTKLGAFLRNSSLDELPQLLNVLLGDMSLVGNRPLPLYEAASLTTDQYAGRFLAPAGITGLWQIKKRGKKDMSVNERISLDIDYATKYSFIYDMWILANTPGALIQKENV